MATTLRLNPSEMATLRSTPRGLSATATTRILLRTFNEGPPPLRTIHFQHGRMIAHCLRFRPTEPTRIHYNIYQLDLNNNNVTPITSGNYQDLSPSWSPDGSKIAFTRNVGNASREIYVHVMSSGQDIRLTNNSVNDTDPSWSPSGRIIFSRHSEDGSRAALFEMDAVDANGDGNGDHLDPISTPNDNEYDQKPEYSRNGKAIVFFRSQEAGGGGPGDVYKLLIQDGTIMEPLLNLTQTNPQHEHGATWKRNGVCVRKGK